MPETANDMLLYYQFILIKCIYISKAFSKLSVVQIHKKKNCISIYIGVQVAFDLNYMINISGKIFLIIIVLYI